MEISESEELRFGCLALPRPQDKPGAILPANCVKPPCAPPASRPPPPPPLFTQFRKNPKHVRNPRVTLPRQCSFVGPR